MRKMISIRLPLHLNDQLLAFANSRKSSVTNVVIAAVEQYINDANGVRVINQHLDRLTSEFRNDTAKAQKQFQEAASQERLAIRQLIENLAMALLGDQLISVPVSPSVAVIGSNFTTPRK